MELCPSYIYLQSTKYDLIDDEKIAHIQAIRANTSLVVPVRLFVCQNQKGKPQSYCHDLSDAQAEKKLCETNKTNYVCFYVDKAKDESLENKLNVSPVYFVVFVRAPGTYTEIPAITAEVKKTAQWLGIVSGVIQCYVFYYSTSSRCNTFDRGTYKEKFDEQCRDSRYSFQFQFIPPIEKPRWLTINGGSPKFSIEVQEM